MIVLFYKHFILYTLIVVLLISARRGVFAILHAGGHGLKLVSLCVL